MPPTRITVRAGWTKRSPVCGKGSVENADEDWEPTRKATGGTGESGGRIALAGDAISFHTKCGT